jgi:uncharacterized protein
VFKRNRIWTLIVSSILLTVSLYGSGRLIKQSAPPRPILDTDDAGGGIQTQPHPLSIESLRRGEYAGSEIIIEQQLPSGSNYQRYITSYRSEGLKIYALLTVPEGDKPQNGWPVIVFNHGYIPPAEYRTAERYIAYMDAYSRAGYILFRPDYRGHGSSEGRPAGYGSNAYSIDALNAVASIKRYKNANSQKIGMWGHSMGGYITLRNMVVRKDIKAGVIWGGVVAPYQDLINWRPPISSSAPVSRRGFRQRLIDELGAPDQNQKLWDALSATSYLADISGPLQLHHGAADIDVPPSFSENLQQRLQTEKKLSELFIYPADDHNLSANLQLALNRSVTFFDRYLK